MTSCLEKCISIVNKSEDVLDCIFIEIIKENFIVLKFDNMNRLTFDSIFRANDAFLGIINCLNLIGVDYEIHTTPYDAFRNCMTRVV